MSDDKFINQIQQTLDDGVDKLDAATLSRLNQARHKALQSRHRSVFSLHYFFHNRLPATSLAAITVVVLAGYLWSAQVQQGDQIVVNTSYDDLELLSSTTELDLLEEIDFVTWLVDEDAS